MKQSIFWGDFPKKIQNRCCLSSNFLLFSFNNFVKLFKQNFYVMFFTFTKNKKLALVIAIASSF